MMLMNALVTSLIWSGCIAVPLRGYYQNPGLYEVKRMSPYEQRTMWDRQPSKLPNYVYDGYDYPLHEFDDGERWQDKPYGDDMWSNGDTRDYRDTISDNIDYQQLSKIIHRWQKEADQEKERSLQDQDTYYIEIDDSDEWQQEPVDPEMVGRIFQGRPEQRLSLNDGIANYGRSNDGMDLYQRIGMKLVDMTKEGTKETEDSMEESVDIVGDEMGHFPEKKDGKDSMTLEKAHALLEQLQEEESEREMSDDAEASEEIIDKAELDAMFNGKSSSNESEETELSSSISQSEEKNDDDKKSASMETVEELEETELQVIKEENQILIEVLRRTPIELIRSPEKIEQVKNLISRAASRQQLVDYIDSQLKDQSSES